MKQKVLLLVKKEKPKLYNTDKGLVLSDFELGEHFNNKVLLNGRIVAECEVEFEDIVYKHIHERDQFGILHNEAWYEYKGLNVSHYECDLTSRSGFEDSDTLFDYLFEALRNKEGYSQDGKAIQIKNVTELNKTIDELWAFDKQGLPYKTNVIKSGMRVSFARFMELHEDIALWVSPKEAYNILNGKQDILIRKKFSKKKKQVEYEKNN